MLLSKNFGKKIFFLLLLLVLGVFLMIGIQYTFKFQSVLYPCIATATVFFFAGFMLKKVDILNPTLSYLPLSLPLIVIQVYGLKINFQGLKYISPSLMVFSIIFFFLGYYFLKNTFKKIYLLTLPIIVLGAYYITSKLYYQEKIKVMHLKATNNWTLKDVNGSSFDMKKIVNKVVFVNFWDSKCAYCFEKLPYIERVKKRIDTTQVIFLEINPARLDNFDTFKHTVLKHKILKQSNSYFEDKNRLSSQLSVSGLPNQFIIDKKGIVRYSYLGFAPDDKLFFEDYSVDLINNLINEN